MEKVEGFFVYAKDALTVVVQRKQGAQTGTGQEFLIGLVITTPQGLIVIRDHLSTNKSQAAVDNIVAKRKVIMDLEKNLQDYHNVEDFVDRDLFGQHWL